MQRFICLLFTLFVVGILGVMTGMGSRGEVLVAVRDQRGEWVDCMGRLHHRYFVGLWRRKNKTRLYIQRVVTLYMSFNCIIARDVWRRSLPHDLGDWYGTYSGGVVCFFVDVDEGGKK